MSLTSRSIVTTAECDLYLKKTITGSALESTIELFIDLCSGQIEEEAGRKFGAQEKTFYLDGSGTSTIILPYPLVALYGDTDAEKLANLQYRDGVDEDWTDLVDDIDLIHFDETDPLRIELLDDEYFPGGQQNIRIRMYAGYDSVPATIKKTCLEMVAVMWQESGNGQGRIGMSSQGGGSAGENSSFDDLWLTRWRPAINGIYPRKESNVSVINL